MKVQTTTSSLLLMSMSITSVVSQSCDLASYLETEVGNDKEIFSQTATEEDAEDLALLLSPDELLAPDDLVEQIAADLTLIRQAFPKTNAVRTGLPYIPGEINVLFTEEAEKSIRNGTFSFDKLDAINNEYGPSVAKLGYFNDSIVYDFDARYNAERLVELLEPHYLETGDILSVEPNRRIGGSHKIYACNAVDRQYTFEYGWGDCPSGCICKEPMTYTVNADDTVTESMEKTNCVNQTSVTSPTAAPTSSSSSRGLALELLYAAAAAAMTLAV